MQGTPGFMRLTVRTSFGEASDRARRLAEVSGLDIAVTHGPSGFEVWVPSAAHSELETQLLEIDAGVVEVAWEEEVEDADSQLERLREDMLESQALIDENRRDDPSSSEADGWDEIASELEDERENWGASAEDGWFYPD